LRDNLYELNKRRCKDITTSLEIKEKIFTNNMKHQEMLYK
jgi:hypothetical protein